MTAEHRIVDVAENGSRARFNVIHYGPYGDESMDVVSCSLLQVDVVVSTGSSSGK